MPKPTRDPGAVASSLVRELRPLGIAERREIAKSYFPSAMKVLGVPVPELRKVARSRKKALAGEEPAHVVAVARALIDTGTFEGRLAAYEILAVHREAMASLRTRTVEALGKGNDNWGTVDAYACMIAGPCWREGQVSDAAVARWSRSKDRWWRRTSVVCTVALNMRSRGGDGDVPRTLAACEVLVDDHDDMIVKGVSWALRTLVAVDRAAVEVFLHGFEERLAARVLREVRAKLVTGRKSGKA